MSKHVVKSKLKLKIKMINQRNEWLNQVVPRLKEYLRENEVKVKAGSCYDSHGKLYKKHKKEMKELVREVNNERMDERIPEELDWHFSINYGQLRISTRYFKKGVDIKRSEFLASFDEDQKTHRIPEYNTLRINYTPKTLANRAERINQKKRAIRELKDSISDLRSEMPSDMEWEEFYE